MNISKAKNCLFINLIIYVFTNKIFTAKTEKQMRLVVK